MGNKAQQDVFVDDEADTCPLCVEEFDLSDRNFKPCPCGYQVCQFCFNNIKSNMNGLCPACRRPYDDKTIEWKVVSPEEFKADVAAQARKKAAARQKEAERKQVETLNKKHLAGLRVLQKNLVYVVGMDISGDDHALETLRGPNHFGQYGEIIKIVASKAKEGYAGHQSTGIYVTFARKEDAATCIATVDGTPHEGRVLRAQYGTTKYCSSFLRNERCTNRNCMFLHETGDDNDSFSRQDLSSFNAASSQRSAPPSAASSAKITYQNPTQIASPVPVPSIAAQIARPEAVGRSESDGDGPALPTTATWAKNPQIEQSRRSSQVASRSTPSPKLVNAKPILSRPASRAGKVPADAKTKTKKASVQKPPATTEPESPSKESDPRALWMDAMKTLCIADFEWKFDRKLFDPATLAIVDHHPPLLNLNNGTLQIMRRKELEKQELENAAKLGQVNTSSGEESQFASGSLQLGGEPENSDEFSNQRDNRGQISFGIVNDNQPFDRQTGISREFSNLNIGGRSLTSQQQRNISLLKSSRISEDSTLNRSSAPSQHHSQLSNPFQSQNQQLNSLSRHGRQTSRFTFSPDPGAASGATKPMSNVQSMNQMSHGVQKNFIATQPGMQSTFYSGVQGPPPGLKASGTPPISGGGMFGQGHGFASVMGSSSGGNFGNNLGKSNEENPRDLLRSRPGGDAGKLDLTDPSILQARMHHPTTIGQGPYGGNQTQDLQGFDVFYGSVPQLPQVASLRESSRPATPSLAPGFGPAEFPPLTPLQMITTTEATPTKFVKPAVPTIYRSEIAKSVAATSAAQGKERQNLTADDATIADDSDSLRKDIISVGDTMQSLPKAANQMKINMEIYPKDESTTSKRKPTSASDSKSTVVTKVANDDMSTLSSSKSSVPTARGETITSASTNQEIPETQTPAPIRNPRTLRLVTAVKAEDSSTSSTPADTGTTTSDVFTPKPMAQDQDYPSAKQPSTPVADLISEDVSLASASASQPGTPNLSSRVHAGPSVTKSKNQVKKERQARAKQLEETRAEEVSLTDESVQAPIIGRKKKMKKAKSVARSQTDTQVSSAALDRQSDDTQAGVETTSTSILEDGNSAATNIESSKLDLTEHNKDDENEIRPMQQPKLTGSSILGNLKIEGILDASNLDYLLNPIGLNARHDVNTNHIFRYESNAELDEEEKEILNCGDSIVRPINPGEWGVILPDRSVLRHLSKEEACHYMDLKFELDHNCTDTFNAADYPREAWMNLTGNDILTGLQVAPPLDGTQNNHFYSNSDTTEPLLGEFASTLLRPDGKDVSYGALYPPRDQAENEEIEARMSMYTLEEAEQTVKASEELLLAARKETEQLEKKLQVLVKKNRKILKD